MNINYKPEEFKDVVSKKDLNEFKDILYWTIEGYKFFNERIYSSEEYDEDAVDIVAAAAKMLDYLSNRLLLTKEEKKRYHLVQSKETLNEDISNLEDLFMNSYMLKSDDALHKVTLRDFMELFLTTDEDFEYTEEYTTFTKIILAAGATGMHKDQIEKISGRPLLVTFDKPCDDEDIIEDLFSRKVAVMNAKDLSDEEKRKLNKSLDYICDYQFMINEEMKNGEYYFVDDISEQKVYKPTI